MLNDVLGSIGVEILASDSGEMLDLNLGSAAISFAAGFVSFISPCVLPLVPIYLGHLAGIGAEQVGGPRATA